MMAHGMLRYEERPGRRNLFSLLIAFFLLSWTNGQSHASVDCEKSWNEVYNKQINLDLAAFRRSVIEILDDPSCSPEQRHKISREAVLAHVAAASRLPIDQRLPVYERATRFARPWQLLEAMGVLLQTKRDDEEQDFPGACLLFQEALLHVQKEHALSHASNEGLLRIHRLAQQSRFLSPIFVRGSRL